MSHINDAKYLFEMKDVMGFKMPIKRFKHHDYTFWTQDIPEDIDMFLSILREVEVRSDDVFICTYPRSGTNWTNEIVRMLLRGNDEYVGKEQFFIWIDAMPKRLLDELPSPRVLISHFPFKYLPKQLEDKGRVICVFRNPKDVAVSYCNYTMDIKFAEFDGTFGDYLTLFYNGDVPSGSWWKHVQDWENVISKKLAKSLLPIYYEDLNRDLRGEVEKIANFLGLQNDPELFDKVTNKCKFSNMVVHKKAEVPDVVAKLSKDKGNYLFRKGKVGDWVNWFTVAQNEEFDKIHNERMKSSELSFTYRVTKDDQ